MQNRVTTGVIGVFVHESNIRVQLGIMKTKFGSKPNSSFILVIKLMAPKMKLLLSLVMGGFNPRTFMDDWSVHRDSLPTEMTSNERYITLYFQLSNVSLRVHWFFNNLVNGEL